MEEGLFPKERKRRVIYFPLFLLLASALEIRKFRS